MKKPFRWICVIELLIVLLLVMILSVSVGSSDLTFSDSLKIFAAKMPGIGKYFDHNLPDAVYETIVWKVRMPRILLSALVGAALAMAGTAYQGVFNNPLSDPFILGVSSGAAFFATLAIISGVTLNFLGLGTIGVAAFIGAVITVFLVYSVSRIGGGVSMTNMLLIGSAVSMMLSAFISLILLFAHEKAEKVYLWTMGSFAAATWSKIQLMAVMELICAVVLLVMTPKLNLLMMGEEDAKSLGTDTRKVRILLIVFASLLVAISVAVSGIIGFVGLIIPHSVRMIGGSDNRKVMPYAALTGAIFLVLCDTLARTAASPTEIPIGIITSICGAPYFIVLVFLGKKKV